MYENVTDAWNWKCLVHSKEKKNSELRSSSQLAFSWNLAAEQGKKKPLKLNYSLIILKKYYDITTNVMIYIV